ncbi:transcription termination factor MTERF15, mitochondrial [Macadamia integrifolia]|uniref:transcription termination factor MTERF15, mitochondrial n=1 Tax=Macadamia integrifolia TaxID=60698 RepID=UPI001C4F008D|nr:transcription termination factor MTERF15, mitochondrial [Macadamia integrifolia]
MAIRTLNRLYGGFHLFESSLKRISIYTSQKIRPFSRTTHNSIKKGTEFPEGSQYRQLISLANLLQRYGFPASQLHEFLGKNRFLLSFSLSDVEKSLGILLSFRLSQTHLVSVISTCPAVLELGFLRKWEICFSELEFSSISQLAIRNVLEHSMRFQLGTVDLRRSLQALKAVGFSDETMIRVLEELPRVIVMNEGEFRRRIDFLVEIGIRRDELDRICRSFPGILGFSVEGRLIPLFREFKDLGFRMGEIRREVIRDPRILNVEFGELSRCFELLRTLKCRLPIMEKIQNRGIFRACVDVKLRVDCLCQHGLIRRDAFKVLQREPRSIIYELEDIEKKIEFLRDRIGFSPCCLTEVPQYLGMNFEKQIIPRNSVIEYLRSIDGLGTEVGLKTLIKSSRLRFYYMYVKPYPECEKIYGRFSGEIEVKPRQPAGLWKLFKPQSYPNSKQDLRNIKLFMDSLV